jgi:uncharacterized protein
MNGGGVRSDEDEPPVPSPCISLCVMDAARRYCKGCLRTIGEITAWGALSNDEKREVISQLATRR